jgi:two-component system nitrogen regulation sensor histidine kinase GlnL
MMGIVPSTYARRRLKVDPTAILNSLSHPIVVIDAANRILAVNLAAEDFFDTSATLMVDQSLSVHIPADNPLSSLIEQARSSGGSVVEYDVTIETMRIGIRPVAVEVACMPEEPGVMVISLIGRSIATKIDQQLTHRGAARSVTAMAAMLAHEVKNPLSGIRGAAQLLDQTASTDDRMLTRLIVDEADRICALVDRMEVFADSRPLNRAAVNIHQVLEHVRRIAQNGFGRRVQFVERYDPSLPPVSGNRDQLVQVFLNLVKNAAEAVPESSGEIVLATAYQHGVKLAVPGTGQRVHLPLVVTVQDNGEGIPDDLRQNLFDPFVTTKLNGTGLGLALVAKIVGDHGGVVEFDGQPGRTSFRVRLPVFQGRTEE